MADSVTPLQAAGDRIRETAKWLTVALAGLGTVLVAGSQLSSLGSLEAGSDRLYVAIGGAALAGIGAVIILAAAVVTAATPAIGLTGLADDAPKGVDTAVADPVLLQGRGSVGQVRDAYNEAVTGRDQAFAEYYADPSDADKRRAAELSDATAVEIRAIALELVGAASYANLAYRWRRAAFATGIGALLSALGIGLFAWAANPPEDAVASVSQAGILTAPKTQYLRLTQRGAEALTKDLGGAACDVSQSLDVLVLGSTASGPDVLVVEDGCKQLRVALTSDWGTVSSRA